jgi:hypothetical protein
VVWGPLDYIPSPRLVRLGRKIYEYYFLSHACT